MYHHKNGLTLKKIEREDLYWMKELKDESWFGTHQISILNMDNQQSWYEKINSSYRDIVLKAYSEASIIGLFKIFNIDFINRCCDVGWDIIKGNRGKGLGKKIVEAGTDFCFEVINLNRLTAEILNSNTYSRKCAENSGFMQEGVKRQQVLKCNEFYDSYVYGIVYTDWKNKIDALNGRCNLNF